MTNYIYYKIVSNIEDVVELNACVDMDTIDDDEPDCEYLNGDGIWGNQRPTYCQIDGINYDSRLEELKEFESQEWSVIAQTLVDCEMSLDEVYKRDFGSVSFYVSYDEDFSADEMIVLPRGNKVPNDLI